MSDGNCSVYQAPLRLFSVDKSVDCGGIELPRQWRLTAGKIGSAIDA
jgi:hypothetical protein